MNLSIFFRGPERRWCELHDNSTWLCYYFEKQSVTLLHKKQQTLGEILNISHLVINKLQKMINKIVKRV